MLHPLPHEPPLQTMPLPQETPSVALVQFEVLDPGEQIWHLFEGFS